jgi:hypothetical protein
MIYYLDNKGIEDQYPSNMKVIYEFGETDCQHFSELLNGFIEFAKGCGFGAGTIAQYLNLQMIDKDLVE